MATTLTLETAATLAAKRTYAASAWSAVVDEFKTADPETVPALGKLETDFPGVKPAHVAHCLKRDIKARGIIGIAVVIDKTHGVCLTRVTA